jgi:hypothetical protein
MQLLLKKLIQYLKKKMLTTAAKNVGSTFLKIQFFKKMLGQHSLKNQYFSKNVEKCLFEKSWSNI